MGLEKDLKNNLPHIIAIVVLIFILLFSLVNFGYLRCDQIPGFCGVYYSIKGEPRVAIVHGEGAIGNPELLRSSLPEATNKFPAWIDIENVNSKGILEDYQLVIVEGPKQISTQTLRVFRDYVKGGGRLVWVGDAGTELGENDYVCREPQIAYWAQVSEQISYNQSEGNYSQPNETVKKCAQDWSYYKPGEDGNLNYPKKLEAGICGKSFGEIVEKFNEVNQSIYQEVTEGKSGLCEKRDNPYRVKDAEEIKGCISRLNRDGFNVTAENADEECSAGNNLWNRGPSLTESGEKLPSLDFSLSVLGVDYLGEENETENLFLNPLRKHVLTNGYGAETEFYGVSGFARVDIGRFTTQYTEKSKSIFNLRVGDNSDPDPAVVTSRPTAFAGQGNVVYFAFPPEVGYQEESQGRGSRLLNNLIEFAIPMN